MNVIWCWITEQLLQPDLPWGRIHEIDTTDDIRNSLQVVVDNNGQLVGNQSIFAQHDEVAEFGLQSLRLPTLKFVNKRYFRIVGEHPKRSFGCLGACATGSGVNGSQFAS